MQYGWPSFSSTRGFIHPVFTSVKIGFGTPEKGCPFTFLHKTTPNKGYPQKVKPAPFPCFSGLPPGKVVAFGTGYGQSPFQEPAEACGEEGCPLWQPRSLDLIQRARKPLRPKKIALSFSCLLPRFWPFTSFLARFQKMNPIFNDPSGRSTCLSWTKVDGPTSAFGFHPIWEGRVPCTSTLLVQ